MWRGDRRAVAAARAGGQVRYELTRAIRIDPPIRMRRGSCPDVNLNLNPSRPLFQRAGTLAGCQNHLSLLR